MNSWAVRFLLQFGCETARKLARKRNFQSSFPPKRERCTGTRENCDFHDDVVVAVDRRFESFLSHHTKAKRPSWIRQHRLPSQQVYLEASKVEDIAW